MKKKITIKELKSGLHQALIKVNGNISTSPNDRYLKGIRDTILDVLELL